MWSILLTLAVTGILGEVVNVHVNDSTQPELGFQVDYDNDQFLLDGQPFRYVSGSFHYFRCPRQYWRDRLRKIRAAGLNAVSTYVEWSLHQPTDDTWDWSGDKDLVEFLKIAQEEGLFVLLRPGPYICAERDFGGFPYWLLTRVPDINLRTTDRRYMQYAETYLTEVFKKVNPFLRGNGGPIIMVQVENEYGSYSCDVEYMTQLRDIMKKHVGTKALLYTTDGSVENMIRCGSVQGVYATVDFGTNTNVTKNFEIMRKYQPRGPLVNSEFYPGWLTHWQEPFQRVKAAAVTETLNEMLSLNASVNMYMFYGGTNFGYTAGANGGENMYSPQLTSYDYDAPLTEAGDPTPKYFDIRNVVSKYLPLPNITVPTVSPKGNYGPVVLSPVLKLLEQIGRQLFGTVTVQASNPLTFEGLGMPHWLVLYETNVDSKQQYPSDPAILHAMVRDRGLVYVDDYLIGTLSRINNIYDLVVEQPYEQKVGILVENQGRLNYGFGIHDFKGLSNVTLNNVPFDLWNMTGFRLDSVKPLFYVESNVSASGTLYDGPVILRGGFTISDHPRDTYLNTAGWGKGVAFVNGRNLGRYWPLMGPQITLYVPAAFLRTGDNELVLIELEYVPNSKKMRLQDEPILNVDQYSAKEETSNNIRVSV